MYLEGIDCLLPLILQPSPPNIPQVRYHYHYYTHAIQFKCFCLFLIAHFKKRISQPPVYRINQSLTTIHTERSL